MSETKDLIYNEATNDYTCPHCGAVISRAIVTVRAWGTMDLNDGSIENLEVTHCLEIECGECSGAVSY